MMEVVRSSVTSVLKRATRRNIPEDGILHSHRRENLKSYDKYILLGNNSSPLSCAVGIRRFLDVLHWLNYKSPENSTFRKLDLFPSSDERMELPTLLGPLDGANLNHCALF
jgi:hypothetical protein